MSSPVPSVVNVPTVLDDTGPEHIDPAVSDPAVSDPTMSDDDGPDNINPATSSKTGSMTYDRKKNGYNLEWESMLRLGLIFVSRVYLFRASISSPSPCVLPARLFRFYQTYFGLSRYLDT
jgi:hypothetical protein